MTLCWKVVWLWLLKKRPLRMSGQSFFEAVKGQSTPIFLVTDPVRTRPNKYLCTSDAYNASTMQTYFSFSRFGSFFLLPFYIYICDTSYFFPAYLFFSLQKKSKKSSSPTRPKSSAFQFHILNQKQIYINYKCLSFSSKI